MIGRLDSSKNQSNTWPWKAVNKYEQPHDLHPQNFKIRKTTMGVMSVQVKYILLKLENYIRLSYISLLLFQSRKVSMVPHINWLSCFETIMICWMILVMEIVVVNVLCLFFIQIWDRKSLESTRVLTGHTGSVLCLQYDENIIVTGSSDSTVRYSGDITWASQLISLFKYNFKWAILMQISTVLRAEIRTCYHS